MTIESILDRIANALEKLAAAGPTHVVAAAAEPVKTGRKSKATPEAGAATATPPTTAAGPAPSAPTPAAPPAAAPAAPAPAATPTAKDDPDMKQTADAIIALANDWSRDDAKAILAKYGVTRVSDLKREHLTHVRLEAEEKIAAFAAAKTNQSLI